MIWYNCVSWEMWNCTLFINVDNIIYVRYMHVVILLYWLKYVALSRIAGIVYLGFATAKMLVESNQHTVALAKPFILKNLLFCKTLYYIVLLPLLFSTIVGISRIDTREHPHYLSCANSSFLQANPSRHDSGAGTGAGWGACRIWSIQSRNFDWSQDWGRKNQFPTT